MKSSSVYMSQVAKSGSDAERKKEMENGSAPVEFNIFGRTLTISPGRVEYNRLRSRFHVLAKEQADAARESILQFKDDPEPLLRNGLSWARSYFEKAADIAIEELLKRGCYDLDREVYLKTKFDFSPWNRLYGKASSGYKKIVNAEKEREAEREERTDAAGEAWMGGGFGLGGAIKGAVQAEVLNLASAAISGTFNAIGRKMSQKDNAEKIRRIFEGRKYEIVEGIFETIANSADALVACCNERGIKIEGAVTPDDSAKAERMCSNLKSGKIPADRVADVKMGILEANPYCREFYDYVYMSEGDASGELEKVGGFFGMSLDERKKDAFTARLGECTCESEAETKAYREKAVALAAELKFDATEVVKKIDERLEEFDRQAKTVDGRLLESRELATKHREISNMVASADLSTEELALEAKSAVVKKAQNMDIDCAWQLERIESALKRFDEATRTVDGQVFPSREEARKQQVLSDFESGLDIATEDAAKLSLAALDAKITELGIDGEWKRDRISGAVACFERMACAAFGHAYSTRDEAKAARGDVARFLSAVEEAVRQGGSRSMLAGADIPAKKASGAVANLGVVPGERIVRLVDTSLSSLFMNMKTGLALTSIGIRWKNGSVDTSRNFISWQEFATIPMPSAAGKLIDFGNGAVFETGGLLGAPTDTVLAMFQMIAGFSREATCFGK